jgi:type IV secretion system protein VirB9
MAGVRELRGTFILYLGLFIFACFAETAPAPAYAAAQAASDDSFELLLQKYPNILNEKSAPNEAAEPVVALPSRFSQTDADAAETVEDDVTSMISEWLAGEGSQPYTQNGSKKNFLFGAYKPRVVCRPGQLTDIELQPGERVTNAALSDEGRWSVSAAWSGGLDNLVTHVLLRTQFPGLETDLMIYTDRRTYAMSVVSSEDEPHTPYVGFTYRDEGTPKEPEIPAGEWRDLLEQYDLLPEGAGNVSAIGNDVPSLIDGADIYSRYLIRPTDGAKGKKIDWLPVSVYDANGKTYIVMPRNTKATPGAHSLLIRQGNAERLVSYKTLRNNLYVVNRVFEVGILSWGGDKVEIRRRDPITR